MLKTDRFQAIMSNFHIQKNSFTLKIERLTQVEVLYFI